MKLNFQKIIIENFLSIGYAEVDLQDRGFTLINGVNNNPKDLALSNGSGKSSIMEAICWSLTGETVRGIKDVVNMFNPGGTSVEIHFDVDKDNYRLIRYKDHSKYKTDLKIFINGEDKSGKGIRDSQKLLESYLPDLTPSLLGSVIILGQGLPQRFTNNTPSGRKEVLEKLSKSDFMIEDLKKRLQERKCELERCIRTEEDELLVNQTKKKSLLNQIEMNRVKLDSMEDPSTYQVIVEKAKLHVKELTDKINELKVKESDTNLLLIELGKKRGDVVNVIKSRQMLDIEKLDTESNGYKQQQATLSVEITHLQEEINKSKSIKDVCPTCGRKFENIFIPDTTKQESELNELILKSSEIKSTINSLTQKRQELMMCHQKELSDSLLDIDNEINEHKAHYYNYSQSINSLQGERYQEESNINKYTQSILTYETMVNTLSETIKSDEDEIKNIDENLVYINSRVNGLHDRLTVINKFNTMITRDFRGYLLKNIIKFIDNKAKEYCNTVFNTNELDFILEGNNIDIKYCGKYMESLSGGEKQKIDLIIQFSIRDMLCQFLNFRSNIIALDEVFDSLDSVSSDKVVNLISSKLSDIDSVFIITHHKELGIPSDNIITVVKGDNGVSRIEC